MTPKTLTSNCSSIFSRGGRLEEAKQAESRVVDQRVDLAEARDARFNGCPDGVALLHVEARHQYISELGQLFLHFWPSHGRDHVPPLSGEKFGGRPSETGRTA